jgi:hypothetical protein
MPIKGCAGVKQSPGLQLSSCTSSSSAAMLFFCLGQQVFDRNRQGGWFSPIKQQATKLARALVYYC